MEFTYSLLDIDKVSKLVWEKFSHVKVWAFYAQMGSGKTTFIHSLCNNISVTNTVASPTFSIINEYESKPLGSIYHLDLYRLKDEEEVINAGVEDCLFSNAYCFIEWPNIAEELLPLPYLKIEIEIIDSTTRKLKATLL